MKGSEFVKSLLNKVGIDNDELNAFATSGNLQEVEVNDETVAPILEQNYFTVESAMHSPEIGKAFRTKLYPEVKAELLDRVDKKVSQVAKNLLNDEQVQELDGIFATQERVEKLGDYLEQVVAEKSDDSKAKATIQKYQKQIEELNGAIEQKEKSFKEELTKREGEFKNNMLKRDVYTIASNYQLQDAFTSTDEVRNSILGIVWDKVNEVAQPKYDEQGKIKLYQRDEPDMELYVDNKKVEVKSLTEQAISPYIKKSDPPKDNQQKPRFQEPNPTGQTAIREMDPIMADRLKQQGIL